MIDTVSLSERREALIDRTDRLLADSAALAGYILDVAGYAADKSRGLGDTTNLVLPGVVIGTRQYRVSRLGEMISRFELAKLLLVYNQKPAPVDEGRVPKPDGIRIFRRPIALGVPRFDAGYTIEAVETLGGQVETYGEPGMCDDDVSVPYLFTRETRDWEAFLHYPPEGLTNDMVKHHTFTCDEAESTLLKIEVALDALQPTR